jgi:nitrogenase molybdenum-iron protein alpha/beta subunit
MQTNDPRAEAAARDHSQRVTYTFMVGVYLATNALKDAYTLVEGPDCAHMKTQYVQGNHDWMSTLTSVSGHHRIANTALHPVQMTKSREDSIRTTLMRMAAHPSVGGVLMTSMPMAMITGADYERLCRGVQTATGRSVIHVPGKSLSGDWMDGYGEVLTSLARQLDVSGGQRDDRKVAIVGHLFDRNEGDHRAGTRELRRTLGALDLEPVSVWLEGQRFGDLAAAKDAGTILSFPYGRKAARWLSRRTGARLVECDLPFGLTASERWVRQLGKEFGREALAEAFIDRELSEIVPALEFMIPFVFQNRKVGYVGDPVLARGLAETAELLGMPLDFVVATNPRHHLAGLDALLGDRTHLVVHPRLKGLLDLLRTRVKEQRVALMVASSAAVGMVSQAGLATVEFGFPSFHTHFLGDRPFLGFRGVLPFVDAMANALRMGEVTHWTERYWDR